MTEPEWLTCPEPREMLVLLREAGRANDRKLRLFAAACCRLVWPLLADEGSWTAVEAAERYADGLATAEEASAAAAQAWVAAARCTMMPDAWGAAIHTAFSARMLAVDAVVGIVGYRDKLEAMEHDRQAGVLRDLFGPLPFRPVTIAPAVLAWDDGCVVKLASSIYEERDFSPEGMRVLADALEEAGMTDAEVLGHCREQGAVHARGCWLIDLLLKRS
jgi:hypothetical protein